MNTVCPPELCVKFPETTILDPEEEIFKFPLLFKFPSTSVVELEEMMISALFVSVPFVFRGETVHVQTPLKRKQEMLT